LKPDSPGVTALPRAGWKLTYRDARWVVIESPDGRTGARSERRRP
jgi:hypothetical protein